MPPKKAAAAPKKAAAKEPVHASYQEMIKEAIINALKKYVQANNNLSSVTEAAFTTQFNRALAKGSETGVFERPKGKLRSLFYLSWTLGIGAPAVEDKAPVVLGKTKSGRITKSTAPSAPATKAAATKKKAAPKKATPKKKAA
ncbi:hypothetical protein D6C98_06843 [Aureobasidium pullulans]|uniref:Histone H1 n=1 Tax=Aureobasidium pullulans TaxID=5580 RepID=A0A4S9CFY7_AURPU|nr:hypothetical protein D6D24_07188 [Aureobasidium pullulans]THW68620.1 hypothetical protein D6D25_01300 [Aureobasidium pullulans]THX05881.1 hypothetical protein D6D13_06777 [Aureobasidium pullulans]THX06777.1 hypothetical protein D6D18_02789 [Aureobasidium pullulans]THY48157.1 hypothetical protein D6C98_06843 [Aureobasidium pullulans]